MVILGCHPTSPPAPTHLRDFPLNACMICSHFPSSHHPPARLFPLNACMICSHFPSSSHHPPARLFPLNACMICSHFPSPPSSSTHPPARIFPLNACMICSHFSRDSMRANPTLRLAPLLSRRIRVEMTCPNCENIDSRSLSSMFAGRFAMYRLVGSCSCCWKRNDSLRIWCQPQQCSPLRISGLKG